MSRPEPCGREETGWKEERAVHEEAVSSKRRTERLTSRLNVENSIEHFRCPWIRGSNTHKHHNMAQKCVHKGCGKVFSDPEEPCQYHPGMPDPV